MREGGGFEYKFFVVLFHTANEAVALKTTSDVDWVESRSLQDGCLLVPAGTYGCLPIKTYVQGENVHTLPHSDLDLDRSVKGCLSAKDQQALVAAIKANRVLSPKRRDAILAMTPTPTS